MQKTQIIKQNHLDEALPDFRSLGVLLRTLLFANAAAFLLAILRANAWMDVLSQFMQVAARLQPVLLSGMLVLYALNPTLGRLQGRHRVAAALAAVAAVTFVVLRLGGDLYVGAYDHAAFQTWRGVFISVVAAGLLLGYFRVRARSLSPAIYRARLQALQARIRPHFLFNCINSVLSVVRNDPKRAESALEDMSDLFRMAMAHDQELVPLDREIELARRYLALEQLRLGDRLRVNWRMEDVPPDALVPPLIVQPLLENAVYHGIEPLAHGGEIEIRLGRHGSELRIEVFNPRTEPGAHHVGNRLALANIRERLDLLFDIEGQYTVESGADFYRVKISMPYVKEERS